METKRNQILIAVFITLFLIFIVFWAASSKQPIINDITTVNYANEPSSCWWNNDSDIQNIKDYSVPEEYVKVPGKDSLYMILDSNNNVTDYVIRSVLQDGSSKWSKYNPKLSSNIIHVEGDIYKCITNNKTEYYKYVANSEGKFELVIIKNYKESTQTTIIKEEINDTIIENGFVVVYKIILHKTYNTFNELIHTYAEEPVIISKTKN